MREKHWKNFCVVPRGKMACVSICGWTKPGMEFVNEQADRAMHIYVCIYIFI